MAGAVIEQCKARLAVAVARELNDLLVALAVADHQRVVFRHIGQLRIAAEEDPVPNHRLILSHTIVVTGDGAGANVDPFPNLCVSQVTQVVRFRSFAQIGFFHLDKVSDFGLLPHHHTGTQMGERA